MRIPSWGVALGGGETGPGRATALRLALLLATRLSHDLSGPLGGLGAALGEMAEDGEAMTLAQDAALVLRQRVALFRAAWGGGPASLARATLKDLAGGLPNASRLRIELDALADAPMPASAAAQVLVSTMLLAAESLPRGGLLSLAGDPNGVVVTTIAGPGAAWPESLGAFLADEDAAWNAIDGLDAPAGLRVLPGPMTALLAHATGVRASLLLAARAETVPPLMLDFSAVRAA